MQNCSRIKREWMGMPDSFFDVLTFGDLEAGDRFICFPSPGDNSGHGGFLDTHYVFEKKTAGPHDGDAIPCYPGFDGAKSRMPNRMPVLKVK